MPATTQHKSDMAYPYFIAHSLSTSADNLQLTTSSLPPKPDAWPTAGQGLVQQQQRWKRSESSGSQLATGDTKSMRRQDGSTQHIHGDTIALQATNECVNSVQQVSSTTLHILIQDVVTTLQPSIQPKYATSPAFLTGSDPPAPAPAIQDACQASAQAA